MPENNSTINTITVDNAELLPQVIRLIDEGHTVTLPLRGFSMRPFLEDGRDKALLTAVDNLMVDKLHEQNICSTAFIFCKENPKQINDFIKNDGEQK